MKWWRKEVYVCDACQWTYRDHYRALWHWTAENHRIRVEYEPLNWQRFWLLAAIAAAFWALLLEN